jgi:hypothetical protein
MAACADRAPSPSPDETAGTLTMALTGVGPDGATYALGSGVALSVWLGDSGTSSGVSGLSTAAGPQSFTLPAGSYTGRLSGGDSTVTAGWPLLRLGDGGNTPVAAALLDPQPYAFTISAGGTTNLPLHFMIANVGPVTFASGTLTTSLAIDAGTVPPGGAVLAGSPSFAFVSGQTSSTALNNALAAIPTSAPVAVPMTVSFKMTGPFTMQADSACAPGIPTVTATALPDAGAEDTIAALAVETSGATANLCFFDAQSLFPNIVQLVWTRTGAPQTPAMQALIGQDAGTAAFEYFFQGQFPTPLFANGVLSLQALDNPLAFANASLQLEVSTGGSTWADVQTIADRTATGAAFTLKMVP